MHDLAWVNDPSRTVEELRGEARARALPDHGNRAQLRARIRAHIAAATANPPTGTATPTTPAATAETPTPVPPTPTPARDWGVVLGPLVLAAGITIMIFGFIAGVLWLVNDPPWNDDDSIVTSGPTSLTSDQIKRIVAEASADNLTADEVKAIIREAVANNFTAVSPGSGDTNSGDPQAAHFARLKSLDPVFRTSGIDAWLNAAGVTWNSIRYDARQIEEETSPDSQIVAAGIQVSGTNIVVNWPVIVTTDDPGFITTTTETVQHEPDQRNPSVLYTNVVLNGKGTIWIDGQNWGQFTSRLGFVNKASSTAFPTATAGIKSIDDLKSLGTIIQMLSADGYLAGAQVRLTKDFTAPSGFVIQKQGAEVSSAKAGDVVSIWVPQNLRVKQ